jgi:hypothetical protein
MASLRDDSPLESFAAAMAALYRAWPQLNADRRRQDLQAAINAAASAIQKPGWPLLCRALVPGRVGQLRCGKSNWSLDTDDAFLEGSNAAGDSWLDTVSAVYHEMRHGEQWYLCAQGVLAELLPLPFGAQPVDPSKGVSEADLCAAMGLSEAVARHAAQRAQQFPHDLLTATCSWHDSIFVSPNRQRGRFLETIKHGGTAGDHLHLPEEQDAWELQRRVRARIKALLGTSLRNPAYAALRGMFGG